MPPLPDHHLWSKAETENQLELLLHFGSASMAQSFITDELAWVSTGIDDNTYNGIAWARLRDAHVDVAIAQRLDFFIARNLPFLWYLNEESSPTPLALTSAWNSTVASVCPTVSAWRWIYHN